MDEDSTGCEHDSAAQSDAARMRLWAKARVRAASLERSVAVRETRTAPDSIDLAFQLMAVAERFQPWPPKQDAVSDREHREVIEAWARLRQNWQRADR